MLNGDAATVVSIVLQKFYPSDDTQRILQRQFGGDTTVKPIAGTCALDYGTTAPNLQKNAFLMLGLGWHYAAAAAGCEARAGGHESR